jgi:hypothetical protein
MWFLHYHEREKKNQQNFMLVGKFPYANNEQNIKRIKQNGERSRDNSIMEQKRNTTEVAMLFNELHIR